MKCKDISNMLSQYLDGDLSPRQASEVRAHLSACGSCAKDLNRLAEAVCLLEGTPREEPQVDLYAGFVRRKARQSASWRPLPTLQVTRRWATAGAAVLIVLAGTVMGSAFNKPRVLYISEPHTPRAQLTSSIAIAAEGTRGSSGEQSVLTADTRLRPHIDIKARGESLSEVISTLAERSKVKIAVSPDLGRQRVYLKLEDVSLAKAMDAIRRLLDADWLITSSPERSYKLVCSQQVRQMASAVAEAQALAEAEDILRRVAQAVQTKDANAISRSPSDDFYSVGSELRKLQNDPSYKAKPDMLQFFILDDEIVSTLAGGKEYAKSYRDMSDRGKAAFREWCESWALKSWLSLPGKLEGFPDEYRLTISLNQDRDSGAVNLHYTIERGDPLTSSTYVVYSPIYATHGKSTFSREDVSDCLETTSGGNPAYSDHRLKTGLGNGSGRYTLLEIMDRIAGQTHLQLVADYYIINRLFEFSFPTGLTLGQLLAVLDRNYGIAWYLSPDNILYMIHRQWPILRESEPDAGTRAVPQPAGAGKLPEMSPAPGTGKPARGIVEELRSAVRERGYLELSELAKMVDMPYIKLKGISAAIGNSILAQNLPGMVDTHRRVLRMYASLSPEQLRMAESPHGLPNTRMTDEQKLMCWEIVYLSGEGATPEALAKPFSFSIARSQMNWQQLQELCMDSMSREKHPDTACLIRQASFGPMVDKPCHFVIFRVSGTYNIGIAFNLQVNEL